MLKEEEEEDDDDDDDDSLDEDDEDAIMVINDPCFNPKSETFTDDASSITNEDESLPMRQRILFLDR